ncbi:beta-glucosidase [Sphingomonas ginkgonis]|uniref:Beta-glucosidase n=1 Tax=Sphingomonas ginkgonis TaxID=2315330 RepID=A0A3R9Z5N3_9SPHN|nr:beta-glucosidase [Sphingomonas ginkgonis]RST30318.1 beta-glucosidase [Sphingomonas ginkgonis]
MAGGFDSFLQAGFECSSHRRQDGVRLDLIRATSHDRHADRDYRLCRELGFRTLRDGVRWHLVERSPGRYDWSSWMPVLEAAEANGLQVIWDLFHYGSPDFVDQAGPDFPKRFTDFAMAAVEVQQSVSDAPPIVCPLNEISFQSWAVEVGYFPRVGPDQKGWFKRQLVRTAVMAAGAIRRRWPRATLCWAEPLVHVAPPSHHRNDVRAAEQARLGQFQAYDWIIGADEPELGGDPSFVDVVGLNFYPHNQWYRDGPTIPMGHHEYRPLADMLVEVAERYGKPIFLSETGAEGSGKASWFHYVCSEVRDAMRRGARIEGICWYPITAYPGWDNSRHAEAGLLSTVTADGARHVDEGLLAEMKAQRILFDELRASRKPRARAAVAAR